MNSASYCKLLLLLVCGMFMLCKAYGQVSTQPNTWWHFDQDYYKFSVSEDGVYKITYSDLIKVGFPVDKITEQNLALYSMGRPVKIHMSHSGPLKEGDYILFYGERNDGTLDADLYADPEEEQLNPLYSLYTDERSYFLTIVDGEVPARYQMIDNGTDLTGTPPKEVYHIHHENKVFSEFHHKPTHNGRDFLRYSSMDYGEGFGTKLKNKNELTIPLKSVSEFGVDPVLELRFGTNIHSRSWQIFVNGSLIKNVSQIGYGTVEIKQPIPREILTGDSLKIAIESLGDPDEKCTVAYYDLAYPRLYDRIKERTFSFSQQASIISRLVQIPVDSMRQAILLNLDGGTIRYPKIEEGILSFVSSASFSDNRLVVVDAERGMKSIKGLRKYRYRKIYNGEDFLILTHEKFYELGAAEYAEFRSSIEGGNHTVAVVNVSDLYNMYSFGIDGHPIAFRNFIEDLHHSKLPTYCFIVGKALEYADARHIGTDVSLVPTFGMPGSDNLLLSTRDSDMPDMAIGRLAAKTNEDIRQYLNKIKQNENRPSGEQTIADQKWKKSIIHFSGGSSDIQNLLFNYLKNMGNIITQKSFGGDIKTFRKTSSDPIETATSSEIIDAINGGAAILSFFGHSAVGTFDFSLENPSKYNNRGKNPIILSLGCHSGNIHTSNRGVSEDFVLEPDNGATHFLASSGTAYINPQYYLGMDFYDLFGEEMYGEPIGMIVNRVLKERAGNSDIAIKTLVQQLTLHGDPAYRSASFKGPDYTIDYSSVAIAPGVINSTTSTFQMTFNIINLGSYSKEVLEVMIIHEYLDGQMRDTSYLTLPSPASFQTVTTELSNPGSNAIGSNKIQIILDPEHRLIERPSEKAKNNNTLRNDVGESGYTFYILDNTASPVYPADFGIVDSDGFILEASLNNAFNLSGEFVIQIDTTEYFNSPLFEEKIMVAQSSQLKWQPDIPKLDNTVYYWRIASKDYYSEEPTWKTRSFVLIANSSSGWNQSHFFQWKKDLFYRISINESSRKFSFAERRWDIRIKNKMKDPNDFWVFVNNSPWKSLNPKELSPGLQIFAWHPEQIIVSNSGTDYGSLPFSRDGFVFKTDTQQSRRNIKNLLDALPNGSRVFLHTLIESKETTLNISDWGRDRNTLGYTLFDILESYGSKRVRELSQKGAVPFTMVFDKGGGLVIEDVAETIEGTIDISSKGRSVWNEGTITSTFIGPTQKWQKLLWSEEKESSDSTTLRIYGITAKGQKELIKEIVNEYEVNLSGIDSKLFPYVTLEYDSKDAQRTSAQLEYWRVLHTELSDAILYSSVEKPFLLEDTVNSGNDLNLKFEIINKGKSAFDPILIRYTLTDENHHQTTFVKRAKGIPANTTISIIEKIKTDALGGHYTVTVEINPGQEQPELSALNNIGVSQVYIRPDRRNPFLDVTFDGLHIKNGQRTGKMPHINVSLSDPGSFVLLDNPDDFKITLYYPEVLIRKITLDDPDVKFYPAEDLDNNVARFMISPTLSAIGEYVLEVIAKDPSGNAVGPIAYRVSFIVDENGDANSFKLSPNPFTEQITFEYTFGNTGIPDIFYLRLFSADGRLVRLATSEDWGGLFNGTNRYIWNGTDHQGNELPAGIYYYEIVNSNDSSDEKIKGSIVKIR